MEDSLRKLRQRAFAILLDVDILAGKAKDTETKLRISEDAKRLSDNTMSEDEIKHLIQNSYKVYLNETNRRS